MPFIDDLLYAFAQWLKSTPLAEFSLWLGGTRLNHLVDSNIWIAPVRIAEVRGNWLRVETNDGTSAWIRR